MADRPQWLGGPRHERPKPEQKVVYDAGRKLYLLWHGLEGQGRDIIDFDLNPQSDRSIVSMMNEVKQGPTTQRDKRTIAVRFQRLADQFASVSPSKVDDPHLWQFASASVNASAWFARRRVRDNINRLDYLANAADIEDPMGEMIDEDVISEQREQVESLRKIDSIVLDKDQARAELLSAAEFSRITTGMLLGKGLNFPFDVQDADAEAYWRAWTMSNPNGKGFLIKQNFHWPWHKGKAEELGWHERHHVNRMGRRQEAIRSGYMDRFFGITTVHGPESAVEEGLAQTITFFVPGAYESLSEEGKYNVQNSILRQMVYLNAQLLIISREMTPDQAIEYVQQRVPWETPTEIPQQIAWRTTDPLNQVYLPQYGIGANHFREYAKVLNNQGKKKLLQHLFAKPYTLRQVDALVKELTNNGNSLKTAKTEVKDHFDNNSRGNFAAAAIPE